MENTELLPTKKNLWEVRFWYSITEHLARNDYPNVIQILPFEEEELIKRIEGQDYILKQKVDYEHIKIQRKKVFLELIQEIALFHKTLRNFKPLPGSKIKLDWGKWKNDIRVYYNRLTSCLAENEIEGLDFSPLCDGLILCQNEISKVDYESLIKYAMNEKQIILNERIKKAFVLFDKKYYVKTIEKCIYDLKSKDLASLIFDYIVDSNIRCIDLESMISNYKMINEFNAFEEFMLRIYLLLPSRAVNQLRKYCKSKSEKDFSILRRYVKEYTKVFNIVKEAVWIQST